MSRRWRWRWRWRIALLAIVPALALAPSTAASAHPLGNFTINVYAGLVVQPHRLQVDYVVDMAEIPTVQERSTMDRNGDGRVDAAEASAYAASACERYSRSVTLRVGSTTPALTSQHSDVTFPPGAAGLSTLRLTCAWTAGIGAAHTLRWSDGNFASRVGWHEVSAVGDRTTLTSTDAPRTSISRRLTSYPKDLLSSPLSQHTAAIGWRDGGSAYTGAASGRATAATPLASDAASRWYTGLLTHHSVTVGFLLLAVLAATLLGSLHALSPGHGKTVMAAYLIGTRGSTRDAVRLGLTMTVTHTAGVLALGLTITAATAWAPERLYPWLSLASGLLIFGTGAGLLRRRRRSTEAPDGHDHPHPHDHAHPHRHDVDTRPSRTSIAALGFAGGMVPSPSAVVVLLGALALHQAWLGVVLVVAYGIGMALMLMTVGTVIARLARNTHRLPHLRLPRVLRRGVPAVSAHKVTGWPRPDAGPGTKDQ
jgi:nickel/cobalt transporter (NicO) family protein